MALVYIVATAPWGPVKIETANSFADMAQRITMQPAGIEDVGALDADQVAATARARLPAPDDRGWITATVGETLRSIMEATRAVSGMKKRP